MLLKVFVLCLLLAMFLLILKKLLPRLVIKYREYKKFKETRKKQITFTNKMKELEIK